MTIFSPNPTANDGEQEEPSTLNPQNDDPETSKQHLYLLQVIDYKTLNCFSVSNVLPGEYVTVNTHKAVISVQYYNMI